MKCRLVVFDLDGTLLNTDHRLDEEAAFLIKRLAGAGIKATIASGRVYRSVEPYVEKLGIKLPVITSNGAVLRDKERIIFNHSLKKDPALGAIRAIPPDMRKKIDVYVFYENDVYTSYSSGWADNYSKILGIQIHKVDSVEEEMERHARGPTMLVCIMAEELVPEISNLFKALPDGSLLVTSSNPYFVDLLPAEAGKGPALRRLTEYLGVPIEETVAFGDGLNDVELLRAAGTGVAVANAPDEVKRQADFVTSGERFEGVRSFIEENVLRGDPPSPRLRKGKREESET